MRQYTARTVSSAWFLASSFLLCLLLTGASNGQCPRDVTPQEAKNLIDDNDDLIVIDVREEASEYCAENPAGVPPGHIPGAFNYPLISGVLEERYDEIPKNADILVVCRSGGRSRRASQFLCSKGFTSIANMLGGMSSWEWDTVVCVDSDGDGIWDDLDLCPQIFEPFQTDSDGDGIGDACEEAEVARVPLASGWGLFLLAAAVTGIGVAVLRSLQKKTVGAQ